jgi:hypothetical protein
MLLLLFAWRHKHDGTEPEGTVSAKAVGEKSQKRFAIGDDEITSKGYIWTLNPASLTLLSLCATDEPFSGNAEYPAVHQFDPGHFLVLEALGQPRPVDLLAINMLARPQLEASGEKGVNLGTGPMVTTPFRQTHYGTRSHLESDPTSRLKTRHFLGGDCIEIVNSVEDCRIAERLRPVDQGVAPCAGVAKNVDDTAIPFQHEWRRGRFLPQLAKQAVSQVVGIEIPNWHLTSSGDGRDAIGAQGNLYEMDLFFSHGWASGGSTRPSRIRRRPV